MRRHGALAASIFLALCPPAHAAAGAQDAKPSREAIARERARKVVAARESGYWIVSPGEHLRLIAQQFFHGDRPRQRQLAAELFARNPGAFRYGDRDRLIVGARLVLPPRLVARAAAVAKRAAGEPAAPARGRDAPGPAPAPSLPESLRAFDAGPARPPAPAPKPAYVDQLIDPAAAAAEEARQIEEEAQPPGRRSVALEYRVEGRYPPGTRHSLEQGMNLQVRRETLNYGDFLLDAGVRDTQPPEGSLAQRRNGARFTLFQERFPLGVGWLADSAIGVVRTPPSFLVNSSYRIFLPTSLVSGATTVAADGRRQVIAFAGHVGRLEGSAVQTFDPTTGTLAGAGYSQRFGNWNVGGQAIALRGNAEVRDHTAATVAAEYGFQGGLRHHKAQLVVDDDSNVGAWFDGDLTTGRLRQRFGLFHLDPELAYGDGAIANDQRGAYWRGDYHMLRYTLSGGADLGETNLRGDPRRAATRSASAYGTFSLRIDRNLTVGGGLTLARAHSRFTLSARATTVSGNAYAAWSNALGLSRLDLTAFRGTSTGVPDNIQDRVSWSQDWPDLGWTHLTSTVSYAREDSQAGPTRRASVGLSARGSLPLDALWDASVVYGRVDTDAGTENDVNVSASSTWRLTRHWSALAQVSVSTFDPLPPLPGGPELPLQRDKRFLLGLRYEESSGTPYQVLGLRAGVGSGVLQGTVYFDENGDGSRQPTERGAPNVTIYLDGRYPATTDSQGRFAFPVVTPGSHALRILSETLPLPWTFADDRPLLANVPLRGAAQVDVPLTRIRP